MGSRCRGLQFLCCGVQEGGSDDERGGSGSGGEGDGEVRHVLGDLCRQLRLR
jgi:hypothetical protein